MAVDGWIALHRQLTENPIWTEKPFSKGQAWVDLLLLANHADKKMMLGNKIVTIKRGQRHTSELLLAERWGWSRHKTRDFLQLLVSEKMLTLHGTTRGTTVTIEKYATYQDFPTTEGTAEGQQKDNGRTSKGTQTTMITMNNNVNKKGSVPPALDEIQSYCRERNNNVNAQKFFDYYTANGWMVGKNKMKDWKAAVRNWESKDGFKAPKKVEEEENIDAVPMPEEVAKLMKGVFKSL